MTVRGTLKQYIRFLKTLQDSNKACWPNADWWEQLLSGVEKLTLIIQKEEQSINDMNEWVDRQISPTIAAIMTAKGGYLAWLHKMILIKGTQRLSQCYLDAITQYQRQGVRCMEDYARVAWCTEFSPSTHKYFEDLSLMGIATTVNCLHISGAELTITGAKQTMASLLMLLPFTRHLTEQAASN